MLTMRLQDIHPDDQQAALMDIRGLLVGNGFGDLAGDDLADRISVSKSMDADGLDPSLVVWDVSLGGMFRLMSWTVSDATTPDFQQRMGMRVA